MIKGKNFESLKSLLSDDSFTEAGKTDLIKSIQKVEPSFGNIKEFSLMGFQFSEKNDTNIMHISGVVIRDKENNQFSIDINNKVSENKILSLDYNL